MKKAGRKLLIVFTLFISSYMLNAQATAPQYQVKAVFLYNFTQFVEWPPSAFADANAPFVIGILGENVFGVYLDEVVRDEKVNGHPIVVKLFTNAEEIKGCHMLFISSKQATKAGLSLTGLGVHNILTVSDADYFARRGGMIGFVNENNKIRFMINLGVAKEANLKFSSKLLRLAQLTESKNS